FVSIFSIRWLKLSNLALIVCKFSIIVPSEARISLFENLIASTFSLTEVISVFVRWLDEAWGRGERAVFRDVLSSLFASLRFGACIESSNVLPFKRSA